MSIFDLNDALQRATGPRTWICWRGVYGEGDFVDDEAMLCNSKGHVVLGRASDGLDALLARMPEAASELAETTS